MLDNFPLPRFVPTELDLWATLKSGWLDVLLLGGLTWFFGFDGWWIVIRTFFRLQLFFTK